jgi:hypothetical protein
MDFKVKLLRLYERNEGETGTTPLDFGGKAKSHELNDISQHEVCNTEILPTAPRLRDDCINIQWPNKGAAKFET